MIDNRTKNMFIFKDMPRCETALPFWLKDREFNTIVHGGLDRKDNLLISLVNQDMSKKGQHRYAKKGLIVCVGEQAFKTAFQIVREENTNASTLSKS